MLREKGFALKSKEEIDKIVKERKAEQNNSVLLRKKIQTDLEQRVTAGIPQRQETLRARHSLLADLHAQRESDGGKSAELKRLVKEQQLLAMVSPEYSTLSVLALAAAAAVVGLVIIGLAGKRKRSRGGLSRR